MKGKILCGFFGLFLILTFSGSGWSGDERYPIMKPDEATFLEWMKIRESAPPTYIDEELMAKIPLTVSLDLLSHLQYTPSERQQGTCGNCWTWSGTGIMEIAHSVQNGIKDRLSIQYINSCRTTEYACCGGLLSKFATFYSSEGRVIPWSNTNAHFQDASRRCSDGSSLVSCGSISTSPSYTVTSISSSSIATHGVGQSTAIANIKNVLNQNRAVEFGFYLANDSDWNNYFNFWDNQSEDAIWNPDYSCWHTWVDDEGGGHATLIVGYDDNASNPDNPYWIVLNSWGTASGNRPNGLFRLAMNMDYDCTFYYPSEGKNYYSFEFETLSVEFAEGSNTTTTGASSTTTVNTFFTTTIPLSTTTIPLSTTTIPSTTTTLLYTTTSTISPNLYPCTPTGWPNPIVPSFKKGTHIIDCLVGDLPTYIDFAICNETADISETFYITLYIDDVETSAWQVDEMMIDDVIIVEDFKTSIAAGVHTIKVIADSTDSIVEAKEDDNSFELSSTWQLLWVSVYGMILGEDKEEKLLMLRGYRDEILIPNQVGKIYVDLLYKHSEEIASLLLGGEDLRIQVGDIIEDLLPEVEAFMKDEGMEISFEMLMDIESLLEDVEVKSSPALKIAIRKLKKDIKIGNIIKELEMDNPQ